ncbi:MAG: YqjD family protein [Arsenophonus endosymbiont of Dermacentor nuttalli]
MKNIENLRIELKSLADSLGEVLNNTENKSKAEIDKIRRKAEKALNDSHQKLSDVSGKIIHQTKEAVGRYPTKLYRLSRRAIGVWGIAKTVQTFISKEV